MAHTTLQPNVENPVCNGCTNKRRRGCQFVCLETGEIVAEHEHDLTNWKWADYKTCPVNNFVLHEEQE